MADVLKTHWEGTEELTALLSGIPEKMRLKGLRKGLQASGRLIVKAQRAALNHTATGMLDASLGFRVVAKAGRPVVLIVGPRRGSVQRRDKATGTKIRRFAGWKKRFLNKTSGMTLGWTGGMRGIDLAERHPTRYAHLVHRINPFIAEGTKAAKPQVKEIVRAECAKVVQEQTK